MNALDTLKKDIDSDSFGRMYLLYGEETYLREYYKKQILSQFENDGFSEFNVMICDGERTDFDSISDFFEAVPMFSHRKLLVINDLDLMKLTGEYKEKFPDLLKDIPEYLTVLFTFSSVDFKPDKRLSMWKFIDKAGVVCNVEKASKNDLTAWIKRRFKALGKIISTENADYLMFLCGDLMTNLVTEIEKISSGTQNEEITRRHIDTLASPTLEAQVFEIGDRVSKKDFKSALELLGRLFMLKYDPVAINAVLAKQMGRMYIAKTAMAAGKGESYIASACGYKSNYPASLLCASARKCSLGWIRRANRLCYQTDLDLKSNIPDNERKLYLLISELSSEESL